MLKYKQVFRGSSAEASVLKTQCYSSFTSSCARFPCKQEHIVSIYHVCKHWSPPGVEVQASQPLVRPLPCSRYLSRQGKYCRRISVYLENQGRQVPYKGMRFPPSHSLSFLR